MIAVSREIVRTRVSFIPDRVIVKQDPHVIRRYGDLLDLASQFRIQLEFLMALARVAAMAGLNAPTIFSEDKRPVISAPNFDRFEIRGHLRGIHIGDLWDFEVISFDLLSERLVVALVSESNDPLLNDRVCQVGIVLRPRNQLVAVLFVQHVLAWFAAEAELAVRRQLGSLLYLDEHLLELGQADATPCSDIK